MQLSHHITASDHLMPCLNIYLGYLDVIPEMLFPQPPNCASSIIALPKSSLSGTKKPTGTPSPTTPTQPNGTTGPTYTTPRKQKLNYACMPSPTAALRKHTQMPPLKKSTLSPTTCPQTTNTPSTHKTTTPLNSTASPTLPLCAQTLMLLLSTYEKPWIPY